MRMRFKVRLKFILVFLILSCILLFNFVDIKNYTFKEDLQIPNKGRKVASISAEELESAWLLKPLNALSNASKEIQDATKNVLLCEGVPCQVTPSVPVKYLKNDPVPPTDTDVGNNLLPNKSPDSPTSDLKELGIDNDLDLDDVSRLSKNVWPLYLKGIDFQNLNRRINKMIQSNHLAHKKTSKSKPLNLPSSHSVKFQDLPAPKPENIACDPSKESCKIQKRTPNLVKPRKGSYASRVKVEPITLPSEWSASPDLSMKLQNRKKHVQEVCQKYGLDKPTSSYQPHAWEFLINKEHGLVWCSIFKAASSTWFYNFNILAGYSDSFLLNSKETPIALARKKYPRPSVTELEKAINSESRPLTFMIARHPFERLVSAYRDKLQSGTRFYRNLAHKIMTAYPDLGPVKQMQYVTSGPQDKNLSPENKRKKMSLKYVGPSFSQFVQYIIHNSEDGIKLDEHWAPMNTFCTPCLVDFDVYAKVESLTEDGNYVIFNSGIETIIKPKRINRSRNEPTNAVAKSYLCQLNAEQQEGLLKLYAMDLELFDYKYDMLFNCTDSDVH